MTKNELARCLEYARKADTLLHIDTTPLHGYGLHSFEGAFATIEMVAAIIAWQCGITLEGELMDGGEFDDICRIFSKKVTLIDWEGGECPLCGSGKK